MMTMEDYAQDVERTVEEIKDLCDKIGIEYEYENISKEDDLSVSEFNFKLYDKENNQLETYPITTKYGTSISKGRKTTASVAYALNSDSNYIELEYYDNMFNDKANCKIVFEW